MKQIDQHCLAEFRAKPACELCGRRNHGDLDPHHAFVKRGMGGGSRLDVRENLIALCRECHQRCEHYRSANHEAREMIARREGVSVADIWERLWAMQRARR